MVSGPIHAPEKSHQHPLSRWWGGNQSRCERFGKKIRKVCCPCTGSKSVLRLSWPCPSHYSHWAIPALDKDVPSRTNSTKHSAVQCQLSISIMHQSDFDALAQSRKAIIDLTMSTCPSVPIGTTRFLLGGFSWNFILEHFSKICR